jgi:hypothetical protein
MSNKLRLQEHLQTTLKCAVGLAIPLMNLLMRVLAMVMQVAEMEEIDTVQDMMSQMIQDKKKQEKGHMLSNRSIMNLNKSQQGHPKTKSSSLGSFSVVSAETLDTMMSHQSQDMEYPGSSSSKQTMLQGNFKPNKCYCGMKPVKDTCRKQGLNYLRQFYRCPQEPNSQKQCHFFQWIRETKSEEYERLYTTSPSNQKQPHTSKKFDKHYVEELSSCEEPEAISPSPIHRQVRGSPRGSTSPPPRPQECHHQWNKRGTNAHIKMKTCTLCGLQEITQRKTDVITQRWVNPSSLKKSGRPRVVSP